MSTRRTGVLLALGLAAGTGRAVAQDLDPAPPPSANQTDPQPPALPIDVPAGLTAASADLSRLVLASQLRAEHFAGAATFVSLRGFVEAGRPAGAGDLVVYVTQLRTARPPLDIDVALRAELDSLQARPRLAELTAGGAPTQPVRAETGPAADTANLVTSTVVWRDSLEGLTSHARGLFAVTATGLAADLVECHARTESAVARCAEVLASLRSTVAAAERLPLTVPIASATAPPPVTTERPPGPGREPARLSDGAHLTLPPTRVPPAPARRSTGPSRHVWVLGGLLLLLAAFLWNRGRRAELDKRSADEASPPPSSPPPTDPPEPSPPDEGAP
ncbi:MAG: hypothetical protein KBG28_13060 [Kofleriaceae bacterium]|nr:hypothetical protein [Kofleriaceae bacterium]